MSPAKSSSKSRGASDRAKSSRAGVSDRSIDSPKAQGDKLANAVRLAAGRGSSKKTMKKNKR